MYSKTIERLSEEIFLFGKNLGCGSQGEVFEIKLNDAVEEKDVPMGIEKGKIYAVKFTRLDEYPLEDLCEFYGNEYEAGSFFNHPNIIKYHKFFILTEDGKDHCVCIIMDYIIGSDLYEILDKRKWSEKTVYNIFKTLLETITHIHSKGFFHKDIKLENIMLDKNKNPIIIDFAFAEQISVANLRNRPNEVTEGSIFYMSPSVITKNETSPIENRDVWALGVVISELCGCEVIPINLRDCKKDVFRYVVEEDLKLHRLEKFWFADLVGMCLDKSSQFSAFTILEKLLLRHDNINK